MTEIFWRRLIHGVRHTQEGPQWHQVAPADWPDHIMAVAVTDQFHAKQGRSTGRWVVPGASRAVYLKRHYQLPVWRGFLAALFPGVGWSPALQEWRHLLWALSQGFPVPNPVAACEYIGPWGRLQSVLAVEELAGMVPLHQAIPAAERALDPATFVQWKRGLVAEIARLARNLHDRRRFHKDFYLCHFFIAEGDTRQVNPWLGRVVLIDLHRLGHHPWRWRRWQAKDLAQLLFSSAIEGVNARDRFRFWRFYLGTKPRQNNATWLRRSVLLKEWAYHRHNSPSRKIKTANRQKAGSL